MDHCIRQFCVLHTSSFSIVYTIIYSTHLYFTCRENISGQANYSSQEKHNGVKGFVLSYKGVQSAPRLGVMSSANHRENNDHVMRVAFNGDAY